jgi:F-type H+-transporting ATPase subunit alpha
MADITLSASDIAAAITGGLTGYSQSLEARTVGRVAEVGDGISRVSGLPDCAVNELLEFEDGTIGLALNLDEDQIGVVVLGDGFGIEEGQPVKATGRILSVPVGDAMLGRVVNALGVPIDGKGDIVCTIEKVEREELTLRGGAKKKAPVITVKNGSKPLVLNRTNADTIAELHGNKPSGWPGKRICLYVTTTKLKGKTVNCIRIKGAA